MENQFLKTLVDTLVQELTTRVCDEVVRRFKEEGSDLNSVLVEVIDKNLEEVVENKVVDVIENKDVIYDNVVVALRDVSFEVSVR